MTICIAAVLPSLRRIVLISDERVSFSWTSAEGRGKQDCLDSFDQWNVMFATDDVRKIPALLRSIRAALGEGANKSAQEVMAACRAGYAEQLRELFESEMLRPFGMTYAQFEASGQAFFGELALRDIRTAFAGRTLATELLVAGFEKDGSGVLFEVSPIGHVSDQYGWNFHAIGSGKDAALSMLYHQSDLCDGRDQSEIVYRLCAAKFAAEGADGVGQETSVACIPPEGETQFMSGPAIEELRSVWHDEGRPPFPEKARKLIETNLVSFAEFLQQSTQQHALEMLRVEQIREQRILGQREKDKGDSTG